jgi:mono/diheme cytochrome c family protein
LTVHRATITIVGTVRPFVLVIVCVLALSATGAARHDRSPSDRAPSAGATTRSPVPAPTPDEAVFTETVKPFLFRNCYQCHNERRTRGNLDLKKYADAASVLADPNTWEHVLLKIRTGEMPPEDEPRPTPAELRLVTAWVDAQILRADRTTPPDPGRVTIRRLNRTEYNNTVRDLLGVDLTPADDFPQDDSGYGFDNIADVLSLPPVLMERYLVAAERVTRAALFGVPPVKPTLVRRQPRTRTVQPLEQPPATYDVTGLSLPNAVHTLYRFPADGEYTFRVVTGGTRPAASAPVELALWIDGRQVDAGTLDPEASASFFTYKQDLGGKTVDMRVRVPAGEHWVAASVARLFEGLPASYGGPNPSLRSAPAAVFTPPPDASPEKLERLRKQFDEQQAERVPANDARVAAIEIGGPYAQATAPAAESLARIFVCGHRTGAHGPACRRRILSTMARRAFRRPVTPAEVATYDGLASLAQGRGESLEESLAVAIQAMLVSPDFLFRIERDRQASDASSTSPASPAGALISDHELAARLSYFLWASMPDAALRRLADRGQLRNPAVLEREVRRMLQDDKARTLVNEFGGQWLQVRALESAAPDKERFPGFDDYLRFSMRQETELFFASIIRQDSSIFDFLTAPYTFVNERLARHYGIDGVAGPEFRRTEVPTPRGGILTHASVLTVSSYATRTSPVLRGKWILENLLDAPPPDPPPGVANLNEPKAGESASVRQQLEAHRSDPTCAACHRRMDPLGFGLENYDAIGAWRTSDAGMPIDATGQLPDGRAFDGPVALRGILEREHDAFARALTVKLLTYALGRGLTPSDRQTVRTIARALPAHDYRFSGLVLEIVRSAPFQRRRGTQS